MPGLAFRPMRAEDLTAIVAAEADAHSYPWSRAQFESSAAAGHSICLGEVEGSLAGFAITLLAADEAELLDIVVPRPYQGRGVGKALLEYMMHGASGQGARCMFLEVRVSNDAALALYRGAGFGEVGRRRGYYPAPSGREDAIVMRRELP